MKKLDAYSSISHLGFVVLGIFSFTPAGLDGATFVMLAHGVSTGALFMLAGSFTSAATRMRFPNSAAGWLRRCRCMQLCFLHCAFFHRPASAEWLRWGVPRAQRGPSRQRIVRNSGSDWRDLERLLPAVDVSKSFFGKVTHEVNQELPDLDLRERITLWPTAAAALVMGVAPLVWLNAIDPAVQSALAPFTQMASKLVGK